MGGGGGGVPCLKTLCSLAPRWVSTYLKMLVSIVMMPGCVKAMIIAAQTVNCWAGTKNFDIAVGSKHTDVCSLTDTSKICLMHVRKRAHS